MKRFSSSHRALSVQGAYAGRPFGLTGLSLLLAAGLFAFPSGVVLAQQSPDAAKPAPPVASPPETPPNLRPRPETTPRQPPRARPAKPSYHRALEGGFPDTPAKRSKVLSNLYAHLSTATDAATANEVAQVIERVWLVSGSPTTSVLMERAAKALNEKQPQTALKFLDAVVELAPDFAEGWNRRALAFYMMNDFARAMGDLRRVLALEPNHFKALQGLGQLLKEVGQERGALEAYRKLLDVHPFIEGGEEAQRELEREVEGQGI